MDLRRLSYFVVACQEQSFAAAAAELKITQSTISGSLKTLSDEFGASLFEHVHQRLYPTAAGIWLYRSALLLLHAEEFARTWIANGPDDLSAKHIIVDFRASFALGRLAKAVSRAIQDFNLDHPDIFVQPCFSGMDQPQGKARPIAASLETTGHALLTIEARPDVQASGHNEAATVLAHDPWVVMHGAHLGQKSEAPMTGRGPYILPGLDVALIEQALRAAGGEAHIERSDEPATILPRLISQQPNAPFLVPKSLPAARAGLQIKPFQPSLFCQLVAHHADDPDARELANLIRQKMAEPEQNVSFRPVLTYRQVRNSRALFEFGSITSAARSLARAQPALSEGLRKLEQTLGCSFFHRSREGLTRTPAGRRLDSGSQIISDAIRYISIQSVSIAGTEGGRLKIGVSPLEGWSSAQCIARAIGSWRSRFPSIRLQVLQGSAAELRKMVVAGTVGLAVTERTVPGMARLKLAGPEAIMLIANPQFNLLPKGAVRLADLVNLPLVLPTQAYGMRQILETAAVDQHLRLVPIIEVNSMPVVLAMLREQPVCTVLPASAVQAQIEAGILRAHPILEPSLVRQFYAFHSGQRDLSQAEREFLDTLRVEFSKAIGVPF